MAKKMFIIVFLAQLISCGENSSHNTGSGYSNSIFVSDSLLIAISPDEYYASIQNHVLNLDEKTYLLRESGMKNSIEIYDWNERKKHSRIAFQSTGPNAVRSFSSAAFFPFNLDSIFIANLIGDLYYTQQDSVLDLPENNGGYRFFGESSYKPTRIGNKIFMHKANKFHQTNPRFYEEFAIIAYDLDSGEIEAIPVEFPKAFMENCWSEHHWYVPFTANNNGQVVISFSTGSGIIVYDPETREVVAVHQAPSELVRKVNPLPDCDINDREQYNRYLKSTPRYLSLTYDPYKNVYYRIIALPVPGDPDAQDNFRDVQPLLMMVLDESFQLLAEKEFPGRKYDPLDFFVTTEGFWLSRNNEEADDFDVNRLSYDLIYFN